MLYRKRFLRVFYTSHTSRKKRLTHASYKGHSLALACLDLRQVEDEGTLSVVYRRPFQSLLLPLPFCMFKLGAACEPLHSVAACRHGHPHSRTILPTPSHTCWVSEASHWESPRSLVSISPVRVYTWSGKGSNSRKLEVQKDQVTA